MVKTQNTAVCISKEYQSKIKQYSNLTGLTQKQILERLIDKFGKEASKRGKTNG
jgi:hypothetical protein